MQCPTCKKSVADAGSDRPKSFPFCSERCKLIDLGRWLGGKYQIPVQGDEAGENDPIPNPNDHQSPGRE